MDTLALLLLIIAACNIGTLLLFMVIKSRIEEAIVWNCVEHDETRRHITEDGNATRKRSDRTTTEGIPSD